MVADGELARGAGGTGPVVVDQGLQDRMGVEMRKQTVLVVALIAALAFSATAMAAKKVKATGTVATGGKVIAKTKKKRGKAVSVKIKFKNLIVECPGGPVATTIKVVDKNLGKGGSFSIKATGNVNGSLGSARVTGKAKRKGKKVTGTIQVSSRSRCRADSSFTAKK